MMPTLMECVPNFSVGHDAGAVMAIEEAIRSAAGVLVLGSTADPDHNRAVITFAGEPDAVAEGAFRGVQCAVKHVDVSGHRGVHPRLGAADVIPFVPLAAATLPECAALAERVAARIWAELGIPCYLYEAAARRPERVRLENVRRGGFEKLRTASLEDPAFAPDIGGPGLHPTAGAAIVGARRFLIAWNVNLATGDLALAKRIARTVRESNGGLPGVKALGLPLASRGIVQVSMNLTDFERTPIPAVYREVERLAASAGARVLEAELIGFLPLAAWRQIEHESIPFRDMGPERIIERRIEQLMGLQAGGR